MLKVSLQEMEREIEQSGFPKGEELVPYACCEEAGDDVDDSVENIMAGLTSTSIESGASSSASSTTSAAAVDDESASWVEDPADPRDKVEEILTLQERAREAARILLSQFLTETESHGGSPSSHSITPHGTFISARLGLKPIKLLLNPAALDTPSNTPVASMIKPELRTMNASKSSSLFLRLQ